MVKKCINDVTMRGILTTIEKMHLNDETFNEK